MQWYATHAISLHWSFFHGHRSYSRAAGQHFVRSQPADPQTQGQGDLAGDGVRVRLEAVKVGRNLVTTEDAVKRLLDELTRRSDVTPKSDTALSGGVTKALRDNGLLPPDAVPAVTPTATNQDMVVVDAALNTAGI